MIEAPPKKTVGPYWPALDGWRGLTIWFAISVHAGYWDLNDVAGPGDAVIRPGDAGWTARYTRDITAFDTMSGLPLRCFDSP